MLNNKFNYFLEFFIFWSKKTFVTIPRIFVRPSLNKNQAPFLRYSPFIIKANSNLSLSPVLRTCLSISTIQTGYLITPECITDSYPTLIVEEWCKTAIWASKAQTGFFKTSLSNITIPFLREFFKITSFFLTDFKAAQQNIPG